MAAALAADNNTDENMIVKNVDIVGPRFLTFDLIRSSIMMTIRTNSACSYRSDHPMFSQSGRQACHLPAH